MKRCLVISGVVAVVVVLFTTATLYAQKPFPRYCLEQRDKNLVKNCEFNDGLNNWSPFVTGGSADIKTIDGSACHTINHPCGYISSGGGFVAGIYQQIPVDPGGVYDANAQLILYDSFDKQDGGVGRTIGLDPTGGTDPNSPAIVWSPEVWAFDHQHRMVFEDLQTQTTAQGNTITLFMRINNQGRGGFTQIWFDEIGMIKVGQSDVPAATPVPPTNTSIPPTAVRAAAVADTPTAIPATATNTALPTATPVPTNTAIPTATPVPTNTPLPTATSFPTFTPRPTTTPRPTSTPYAGLLQVSRARAPLMVLAVICFGGGGILVFVGLIGLGLWIYRAGREKEQN